MSAAWAMTETVSYLAVGGRPKSTYWVDSGNVTLWGIAVVFMIVCMAAVLACGWAGGNKFGGDETSGAKFFVGFGVVCLVGFTLLSRWTAPGDGTLQLLERALIIIVPPAVGITAVARYRASTKHNGGYVGLLVSVALLMAATWLIILR